MMIHSKKESNNETRERKVTNVRIRVRSHHRSKKENKRNYREKTMIIRLRCGCSIRKKKTKN